MHRKFAVAMLLSSAAWATASTLTWDSSGANPASPVDGSGTWDTSTPLWSDGTTDLPWDNAANNTAVFGNSGPGGAVTIDPAGVTTSGIAFHAYSGPNPYSLTGGPITLATANPTISFVNAGVVPVIYSQLTGSNVALTLSGILTLSAASNSYTGSTTVTNGSAAIIGSAQNQHFDAPFGAPGNSLSINNSQITANGSTTGASVSYQTPYNITVTGSNIIQSGKNFTLGALSPTLYTVRGDGTLRFNSNLAAGTNSLSASFSGTGADAFTGTLQLTTNGSNPVKLNPPSDIAHAGNFLGVPNGTLDLQAAVAPQTVGQPYTFSFGALTGNGQLGGGFTPATIATWSVGALGLATTYFGTIAGNAALTLTGGTLTLANPFYKPDTYTGPTNVTGGTLVLAGSNLTSTSSISVASGATLRLQSGISINNSTLALASGGTLDVTSNSETFDTTVPGHDAASLIAAIGSAYDDGAWDGVGITSSIAAPSPTGNPVLSIGYRVIGSQFLLQLTHIGDANLDGTVNADDYALLDRSYAQSLTNAGWTGGDFNYDGVIDASDYQLIDRVYFLTHGFDPGFLAQRESQFGDAYVSTLLASVPEPSPAACLVAIGPLLVRRRRRARG